MNEQNLPKNTKKEVKETAVPVGFQMTLKKLIMILLLS